MKALAIEPPRVSMRDHFLNGREAHAALARHLGPGEIAPDCGERLGVSAIVFTLRTGRRLRVAKGPEGIAVRELLSSLPDEPVGNLYHAYTHDRLGRLRRLE